MTKMKIRQGFVSNSSTTSYMVIVDEKHYEKMLKKSNALTKAVMKSIACNCEEWNNNIILQYISNEDSYYDWGQKQEGIEEETGIKFSGDEYEVGEKCETAFTDFLRKLEKDDKKCKVISDHR